MWIYKCTYTVYRIKPVYNYSNINNNISVMFVIIIRMLCFYCNITYSNTVGLLKQWVPVHDQWTLIWNN